MTYCPTQAPLPISTWIEILLVFSFEVWPRTDLMIVVFYVPDIPTKVAKIVTLYERGAEV